MGVGLGVATTDGRYVGTGGALVPCCQAATGANIPWPCCNGHHVATGGRHLVLPRTGITFHFTTGGIPCGQGMTGGNILHHHGKRGICCYHRGIAPRYDGSTMRSALRTPGPLPLQSPQERMTDRQAKSLMREGPHIARSYYRGGGVFDAAITGVTFGVSSGVAILFNTFLSRFFTS